MPHGYNGRILHLDLSTGDKRVEEPEELFYRRYFGGRNLIAYYLLKNLKPKIDPLGPENLLIFAAGLITGAPIAGSGRNSVGGKSPLTEGYGEAEAGGFWGAELRKAGYDALVIRGRAKRPVYIWIDDQQVEVRDASHLWGQLTAPVQEAIQEELEDPLIRVAQIGPAGENLVRFACVVNDLHHFAGRTGMGAVMGSKNLKAIAVRGRRKPSVADPEGLRSLAQWLAKNYMDLTGGLHKDGTAGGVEYLNKKGGLPTRNFQASSFDAAEAIAGSTMTETILVGRKGCHACAIRCKRRVAISEGPFIVDPTYGGPEYETIAALGSNCGVSDLAAIAKGNELCAAYGLDTISTGSAIAFAMECYEKGLLTHKDTDGLELAFGNGSAMVEMVRRIARREGLGDALAEGVKRAAERIGSGAEEYALHVKGQEIPMHEPRWKQGMGIGYLLSATGADHCHNLHDNLYTRETRSLRKARALAILEPLPVDDLSPAKVRLYHYVSSWRLLLNSLGLCLFLPYDYHQVRDLVNAVTGWNTSLWELLKVGERGRVLARAFNAREGQTEDDRLPRRFLSPLGADTPALEGVAIEEERLEKALITYYKMAGWDPVTGIPTRERLEELDIGWVAEELARWGKLP